MCHEAGLDAVPVEGCECRACSIARCTPFERRYGFELIATPVLEIVRYDTGDSRWQRLHFRCGCTVRWDAGLPESHPHHGQEYAIGGTVCEPRYCLTCVRGSRMIPVIIVSQFTGPFEHVAELQPPTSRVRVRFEARHELDFSTPNASIVYRILPTGKLELHASRIDSSD